MTSTLHTIDVDRAPEHIELGDSEPSRGPNEEASHWRFVRWLLVLTLIGVACIVGVNWFVDPTGVTGRNTRWLMVDNAEVRAKKLDLYDARRDDPQVLLLGSSRAMKLDPATVEALTGERAFNGAVSGGTPRDMRLFVQYVAAHQRGRRFPHLVWALDVDAFRTKRLRDGLSGDARVARFIPRTERATAKVGEAGELLQWQTLKATWRAWRIGGWSGLPRKAALERPFAADGFQTWSLPYGATQALRNRAIRAETMQYAGFIFGRDAYTRVELAPRDDFERVIRIANAHGDTPTIALTPYHPLAWSLLAPHHIDARAREVRRLLERLQREGDLRFQLVDLQQLSSFGGDPAQFYDGVHMTKVNTDRFLAQLERDGVLSK